MFVQLIAINMNGSHLIDFRGEEFIICEIDAFTRIFSAWCSQCCGVCLLYDVLKTRLTIANGDVCFLFYLIFRKIIVRLLLVSS